MKFYLAPLEGITGFIYRNAYAYVFNDIDKYFAPFVVPNKSRRLKTKEFFDILPENNNDINLIPQILTNDDEGFIYTAQKMKKLGYNEINLNLGCPSSIVVNKDRGSGFLALPDKLDEFLERIYNSAVNDKIKVSIKTRIGKNNADEFMRLLEIYNKYPVEELIIHPRTQKEFYGKNIHREMFTYAIEHSKNRLCYNGNIFTPQDYSDVLKLFVCTTPSCDTNINRKANENVQVNNFMIGRGIIANPGLIYEIKNNKIVPKDKILEFHNKILNDHLSIYDNERNILFKMKEIWSYMIYIFSNNKSYALEIKKSQNITEYKAIVNRLFREQHIVRGAGLFS